MTLCSYFALSINLISSPLQLKPALWSSKAYPFDENFSPVLAQNFTGTEFGGCFSKQKKSKSNLIWSIELLFTGIIQQDSSWTCFTRFRRHSSWTQFTRFYHFWHFSSNLRPIWRSIKRFFWPPKTSKFHWSLRRLIWKVFFTSKFCQFGGRFGNSTSKFPAENMSKFHVTISVLNLFSCRRIITCVSLCSYFDEIQYCCLQCLPTAVFWKKPRFQQKSQKY